MAIPAVGLFAVTATGVVAPWMVYLAVFAMGSVNAIDNPTRQSFVIEMVGPDRVVNAVSLNSVIVQMARIVGPAVAGILIATLRRRPLLRAQRAHLRGDDLRPAGDGPRAPAGAAGRRARAAARSGPPCATSARTPELAVPLALMALVGTLGFNFQVVLPLLAKFSFDGGAMTYAALVSAMAVGSIAGALVNGHRGRTGPRLIAGGALAFGVSALLAAAMPSLTLEMVMLAGLGAAAVTFAATINSTPAARGRAGDAGPGDGALLGRLPRLDPDRRPPDRLARRNLRPPRRPTPGRRSPALSAAWAAHVTFARLRERAGDEARSLRPTAV